MRGDIVIRRNSLPSEPTWEGEEFPPAAVPGRWRRVSMRFGPLEFSYASVKLLPSPERHVAVLRRPPLHSRFFEHVGLTLAALVFLGGSATLIAMQSGAFVPSRTSWQIVTAEPENAAPPATRHAPPATQASPAPTNFIATGGATAPATAEPVTVRPAPAPVARIAAPAPRAEPSFAEPPRAKEPAAAKAMPDAGALSGSLERNPAVARAISRAMTSGEVQDWSSGPLSGVVVVGEAYDADGRVCREGSILARDGGPTGRTESFERCTRR